MSAKPKKRPEAQRKTHLDRPFAPSVWRRAVGLAERYSVVIRLEAGEFYGRGLELPWAMDDGATSEECLERTREAMAVSVATMLERGEPPPKPMYVREPSREASSAAYRPPARRRPTKDANSPASRALTTSSRRKPALRAHRRP